ncbi:MAG: glycoside hydrolase family 127 protein [Bacteroidaceae bacterium]|nr:glycoside hydrolase family 127 protein [Bacteroidaceae bacterium]
MKRISFFSLLLASALCASAQSAPDYVHITAVEGVRVTAPVGTVPRLPYRLWTVNSDGTKEYRQVRWQNASPQSEQEMMSKPAGSEYTIQGYIIGDNTTTQGLPVTASVKVEGESYATPSNRPIAEPLPLNSVSIIGDNRLTHNRDLDIDQLLSLDVKQQLYNYRDTYGLPTDGYPEADGWDSPTTKLKGHGSGHYMSAMAMAYASCTNAAKRQRLKENLRTMVDELRACQERTFVYDDALGRYREARDLAPESELRELRGTWADFDRYKQEYAHYGYGYLNAIPAQHCVLIEMYRAYNNEQWVWAPYYSVHKQLAGLIDIANYVDDKAIAGKALTIARDMGLWVWNRLHYRTFVDASGSQAERRARPGNRYEMWNMYIAGEVGGMAESLARLSELVKSDRAKSGNSSDVARDSERLLEAATYFDSPAFFDPLAKNADAIRTRHANQHIPMVTGALRAFRAGAGDYYYNLAESFWTMVQGRYRYAMGGVGNGEMFRQPYTQILSMATNVGTDWRDRSTYPEPTLNETCCAYNLAKLTKDLNGFNPNDARYMDYYERVLYNQIIGSLNPHRYAVLYQYAVGLNASKPWGNETPQSTCCGGTGVENHVKYQEAAYFVGDDTIWVALYLPSVARWDERGVTLRQECQWPAESSAISFDECRKPIVVKLRTPYWATSGFDVKVNGESVAERFQPGSYVTLPPRRWTKTDRIEVIMPFSLHFDFGPDKLEVAATGKNEPRTRFKPEWCGALMNGPLVMSATGITTWDEATIEVKSDRGEKYKLPTFKVKEMGTQGKSYYSLESESGNYHFSFSDSPSFLPDYDSDRHSTHYFRILLPGTPITAVSEATVAGSAVDDSRLLEAMALARSRRDAQNAWNALEVKVPEYAPWARHGYARLIEQFDRARALFDDADRSHSQTAIDQMTTDLNAAIATMRPGNLPELEDLSELLPLLTTAKEQPSPSTQLRDAIDYAEMVVKYVSDGSGTADMIERATRQLKEAK